MGVMDMMSGKASRKKAEQYAPQIAVNLTGAVILQDFIDKEGDNLSRFQWLWMADEVDGAMEVVFEDADELRLDQEQLFDFYTGVMQDESGLDAMELAFSITAEWALECPDQGRDGDREIAEIFGNYVLSNFGQRGSESWVMSPFGFGGNGWLVGKGRLAGVAHRLIEKYSDGNFDRREERREESSSLSPELREIAQEIGREIGQRVVADRSERP